MTDETPSITRCYSLICTNDIQLKTQVLCEFYANAQMYTWKVGLSMYMYYTLHMPSQLAYTRLVSRIANAIMVYKNIVSFQQYLRYCYKRGNMGMDEKAASNNFDFTFLPCLYGASLE